MRFHCGGERRRRRLWHVEGADGELDAIGVRVGVRKRPPDDCDDLFELRTPKHIWVMLAPRVRCLCAAIHAWPPWRTNNVAAQRRGAYSPRPSRRRVSEFLSIKLIPWRDARWSKAGRGHLRAGRGLPTLRYSYMDTAHSCACAGCYTHIVV